MRCGRCTSHNCSKQCVSLSIRTGKSLPASFRSQRSECHPKVLPNSDQPWNPCLLSASEPPFVAHSGWYRARSARPAGTANIANSARPAKAAAAAVGEDATMRPALRESAGNEMSRDQSSWTFGSTGRTTYYKASGGAPAPQVFSRCPSRQPVVFKVFFPRRANTNANMFTFTGTCAGLKGSSKG